MAHQKKHSATQNERVNLMHNFVKRFLIRGLVLMLWGCKISFSGVYNNEFIQSIVVLSNYISLFHALGNTRNILLVTQLVNDHVRTTEKIIMLPNFLTDSRSSSKKRIVCNMKYWSRIFTRSYKVMGLFYW